MWRQWQRFISLSCLSSIASLFVTSVTLSSLAKALFPHFINPIEYLVNHISSFSQSIHKVSNHHRLEWFVNCIFSFLQYNLMWIIIYQMVCIIFGGQVFYQVMNQSALSKDLLNLHKTPFYVLLAKPLTLLPYKSACGTSY